MTNAPSMPVVVSLSGHDPSGGAGIQADIEAIAANGCHACTIVTALTVQNTTNVDRLIPQPTADIVEQFRCLIDDITVAAIKIGLIGMADCAEAVADILSAHPAIPVVLDPVLKAGGGEPLADAALIKAIRDRLLPRTTVLTPNSEEARRLAPGQNTLDACGRYLLQCGCRTVLITGTHEPEPGVCNRLYADANQAERLHCTRLPHSYHGSGCTLASAIAAGIAKGQPPMQAIRNAQVYTWNTLRRGFRPGTGQYLPNRIQRTEFIDAASVS